MSPSPQSFENHAKMVPAYHYLITLLGLVTLVWFGYRTVSDFTVDHLMMVLLVLSVLVTAFYTRMFPLGVQDRVIRMEERVRLERVLPETLRGRAGEITTDQFIGLRFASDEEVAGLVERVLGGELRSRDDIKKAVTSWRADHQRI